MSRRRPGSAMLMRAEEFREITDEHVRRAVQLLLEGTVERRFGRHTRYDVLTDDGARLPPKEVFGLAAKLALGRELVPDNFRGGERTTCFRVIRAAGFRIEPKDGPPSVQLNDDDREWAEGEPRRVTHLGFERSRTAARLKRAAFREEHGLLRCENCGMIPTKVYDESSGDACIEVHHIVPLYELGRKRRTRLEDLVCVCANCHRILHHEMRQDRAKNPQR